MMSDVYTPKETTPAVSPAVSETSATQDESFQKTIRLNGVTKTNTPVFESNFDFSDSFASGIVKITVDAPNWPFHLHIAPLQAHSTFFARNLNPAGTRTIQTLPLPYIKLEPFKLFIEYVYTHNYTIPAGRDFHACWLHAQVYFMGVKIGATGLKVLACDKLKNTLGGKDEVPIGAVVGLVRGVYEQEDRNEKKGGIPGLSSGWEKENDEPEDEDEEMGDISAVTGSDGLPSDGSLKMWVVRYVAHKIEKFRVSPEFRALVDEHRDFAFDLLCAVSSGPPLVG